MTVRRRLTLSFLAILGLCVLNLIIFFWGNQKRNTTVEELRGALSRQVLLSSIRQNLSDLQKQLALLSGDAAGRGTPSPAQLRSFDKQLDEVARQIRELAALWDPQQRGRLDAFERACSELSASWRMIYLNLGSRHAEAIRELAVHADPLGKRILLELLPQLQQDEKVRVKNARDNFDAVGRVINLTILIFVFSTAAEIVLAYLAALKLTRGLSELREGAARIGSGQLDQRIGSQTQQDLTVGLGLRELRGAFNEMTDKLLAARTELTRANEQERKKSEQLEETLQQLRKAQDQLVVQQKLASLGALTAGIAHEIKNPLNFVTNFAALSLDLLGELREELKAIAGQAPSRSAELDEILASLDQNMQKIREHGRRADSIVHAMLMHSRGGSAERQPTNINTLLAEYVSLAYHGMRAQEAGFHIALQEDYDPSLEPVCVIPQDLSRVILNIANNACYAAYEKKKKTGDGFSPTVSVRTRNLGDSVEIRIRDNGGGIPEGIRRKIFDPFFTTKPAGSGTGLGLSMSYEIIVQEHKGDIRVETEEGQYAEFIITLPKEPK